jgi:hypothetical protein
MKVYEPPKIGISPSIRSRIVAVGANPPAEESGLHQPVSVSAPDPRTLQASLVHEVTEDRLQRALGDPDAFGDHAHPRVTVLGRQVSCGESRPGAVPARDSIGFTA